MLAVSTSRTMNLSRPRVAGSAQWRSSMTITRGVCRDTFSRVTAMPSYSRSAPPRRSVSSPPCSSSGRSRPSESRAGPAAWSRASTPITSTSARRVPLTGAYGGASEPRSTHCPRMATTPSGNPLRNSLISRVLPIPASPPRTIVRVALDALSARQCRSLSRSSSRPMRAELPGTECTASSCHRRPPFDTRSRATNEVTRLRAVLPHDSRRGGPRRDGSGRLRGADDRTNRR